MKYKHALVTGGAGLIGSHLVDLLIEQGYKVNILDSLEPQTHPLGKPAWVHPKARFIKGDVRSEEDLLNALAGVDCVFHQAAFGGFTEQISKYIDVNVSGTAKIFQVIVKHLLPVKKMVVASSQAVYAEGAYLCEQDGMQFPTVRTLEQLQAKKWEALCPVCGAEIKPVVTAEEKRRDGYTPYALSKEFEERLFLAYGQKTGIPTVALRYAVTYGPRQSLYNPYTGVVSIFSARLLNGLAPIVFEDGRQTRDFVFSGDVAQANLFVLQNERANGQVFNVSTGRATAVADLTRLLASIYGKAIEPAIPGEFRWGDVRHIALDPLRLNALGFFAQTRLEDGLQLFSRWMLQQGDVRECFSEGYDQLKKNGVIHE